MDDSAVCWLNSNTGHFDVQGLLQLQYSTAQTLIEVFKSETPIYVLRALMELLKHGQFDKLREVGADKTIRQMWQSVAVTNYSAEAGYKYMLEIFFNVIPAEAVC